MDNDTLSGHHFIHVDSVDSTNNFAAKFYKEGKSDSGTVIMADFQTNGKGQRGRAWQSDAGKNITATLIYKSHSLKVEDSFYLNIAISLAIANYLEDIEIEDVEIKWPNDILVDSKKIAGILIENVISGNRIELSYLGIGFNVNQDKFENLKPTSLRILLGKRFDVKLVLGDLIKNFDAALYQLELRNFEWLKKEYLKRLFQYNRPFEYYYHDEIIVGTIKGFDEGGRLMLERQDSGEMLLCNLKEVKFIFEK